MAKNVKSGVTKNISVTDKITPIGARSTSTATPMKKAVTSKFKTSLPNAIKRVK